MLKKIRHYIINKIEYINFIETTPTHRTDKNCIINIILLKFIIATSYLDLSNAL